MSYDTNLTNWAADGKGKVECVDEGEWQVSVATPLTLWCPDAAAGNVEISFENQVMVENSAMLLFVCANNWRGESLLNTSRGGQYDDYALGDLEAYTIGFNRAAHVTADVQPNATSANVRRIGGPTAHEFHNLDLRDQSPKMMARWQQWNTRTLLCSAYEPASGIGQYYRYRIVCEWPKISLYLEGNLLLTVVDHKPQPLRGGHIAIRNMTPGGKFRIRNIQINDIKGPFESC